MKLIEFLESLQIDTTSKECLKRDAAHIRERINGTQSSLVMKFDTEEKWLLAGYLRERAYELLRIAEGLER